MIVVDAHTHVPVPRGSEGGATDPGSAFLAMCDRFGVDMAWVFTTAGLSDPSPRHNDSVVRFCATDPARLLPFCTVFPHLPGAVEELHRAVEEGGARGLKLHPWLQGFSPLGSFMDELGRALERLNIPVVFHDGTPPNSSPLQIAHFAERHPDVPVVLGHGGLHDLWQEAMAAVQRVPNLWLIPSGTPPYGLRQMLDTIGTARIVFGSDAGYGGMHWQPFQLRKIRELALSRKEESAVLAGNALKLVEPVPQGRDSVRVSSRATTATTEETRP